MPETRSSRPRKHTVARKRKHSAVTQLPEATCRGGVVPPPRPLPPWKCRTTRSSGPTQHGHVHKNKAPREGDAVRDSRYDPQSQRLVSARRVRRLRRENAGVPRATHGTKYQKNLRERNPYEVTREKSLARDLSARGGRARRAVHRKPSPKPSPKTQAYASPRVYQSQAHSPWEGRRAARGPP